MDDKDISPFGYTFTPGLFDPSPTSAANNGPNLLSEIENQSLQDFFSHTDPFLSSDAPIFPPTTETKEVLDDLNWNFVPPATIHRVSTTIPDQTQFQHSYHTDQNFLQPPLSASHVGNTQDDLQAASMLFTNAQASHSNGRSYSFDDVPSSNTHANGHSTGTLHSLPLVPTSTGMLNEQLAALLPNHSENGSIDAQLAAQFANSNARQRHHANLERHGNQRPHLKRSFTYGTDSAFDPSGFIVSSPRETHEYAERRLISEIRHAERVFSEDAKPQSPSAHFPSGMVDILSDNDAQSEEGTSDDDDDDDDDGDRPAKKRRKSKISASLKNGRTSGNPRKSISTARPGKNRKASIDDQSGKKKRLSSAGQKVQRENLTEEQKRSNHILSEQKRRNLIKRGFDDLHELVPEIRNGGLSKSSVLMEAANFLDKLIEDNNTFIKLAGTVSG